MILLTITENQVILVPKYVFLSQLKKMMLPDSFHLKNDYKLGPDCQLTSD